MSLRVALLADPFILQRVGGIQLHILNTQRALQALGIEATVFDPAKHVWSDFDLVEVFDAESCNFKLTELVKAQGLPLVVSPTISPKWNYWMGWRARLASWLATNITGRHTWTNYAQVQWALNDADLIVTMGRREQQAIIFAFGVDEEKLRLVPPGVTEGFFQSDPALFVERFAIEPGFVLIVASVGPQKNQRSVVQAMRNYDVPVVLLGACQRGAEDYLHELKSYPHVHHLGTLPYNDPLFASAFAAAGVLVHASQFESGPMVAFEAMAAGTPVVLTKHHSLELTGMEDYVRVVTPYDQDAIRRSVNHYLENAPAAEQVRATVSHLTWTSVTRELLTVYREALER